MRMKTIKGKITKTIIVIVVISMLIVGAVSSGLNIVSSNKMLADSMGATAKVAAQRVEEELIAYKNVAKAFGSMAKIASNKTPKAVKKKVVDSWVSEYGFQRGNLIDNKGIDYDGNDYSSKEFVKQALEGKTYVSIPLKSDVTGELSIYVSAPIWKDGEIGGKVIGAVYFVPKATVLNDIMTDIKVSENGTAYMIDKDGNTIADVTMDSVMEENIERDTNGEKGLEELASIHSNMREGKAGFGEYKYNGNKKIAAYCPVEGSDGWSIAVTTLESDFTKGRSSSLIAVIILIMVVILLVIVVANKMAKDIAAPVLMCSERMKQLAKGDFHSPIAEIDTADETRLLRDSIETVLKNLNYAMLDEIKILENMSEGNFDVEQKEELYVGDLKIIYTNTEKILDRLEETFREMKDVTDHVARGSSQVADGSQQMAQGATEQASSVEELAATIHDVSENVNQSTEYAEQSVGIANAAGLDLNTSNQKMKELMLAMEDISNHSIEIEKIIKTIEDIAFQTNILALNAAVEAARAGEAGKGFAVVADEVRNLAGKSADASKNTATLIEQAKDAVERGNIIANETFNLMDKTAESVKQAVEVIGNISRASVHQNESINQISVGVDQISSVVQTNTVLAEESAATSEELSALIVRLRNLINRVKLSNDNLDRATDEMPIMENTNYENNGLDFTSLDLEISSEANESIDWGISDNKDSGLGIVSKEADVVEKTTMDTKLIKPNKDKAAKKETVVADPKKKNTKSNLKTKDNSLESKKDTVEIKKKDNDKKEVEKNIDSNTEVFSLDDLPVGDITDYEAPIIDTKPNFYNGDKY